MEHKVQVGKEHFLIEFFPKCSSSDVFEFKETQLQNENNFSLAKI